MQETVTGVSKFKNDDASGEGARGVPHDQEAVGGKPIEAGRASRREAIVPGRSEKRVLAR